MAGVQGMFRVSVIYPSKEKAAFRGQIVELPGRSPPREIDGRHR